MTSTANLNRLQNDLKDRVKGEYKIQNTRNKTHVIKNKFRAIQPWNFTWRKIISTILSSPKIPKRIKIAIRRKGRIWTEDT
jgi:hypothetical protein